MIFPKMLAPRLSALALILVALLLILFGVIYAFSGFTLTADPGYGENSVSAMTGRAGGRDLAYIGATGAAAVVLLIGFWKFRTFRWGALTEFGVWALFSVASVSVGLKLFGPMLDAPFWGTHESEWLGYIGGACDLYIHGWMINCWPAKLMAHWGADDHRIQDGRLIRLALGMVPYLVAPTLLYLAFRIDELVRGASDRPTFLTRLIIAAFVFCGIQGAALSFGDPAALVAHTPVRDNSLALLTLMSLLALFPLFAYRDHPSASGATGALIGLAAPGLFLFNILAPVQCVLFIVLLTVFVATVSTRARLASIILFIGAAGFGALVTTCALYVARPEILFSSLGSLAFFAKEGRNTFSDQFFSVLNRRTLISLVLLGAVGALTLYDLARSGWTRMIRSNIVLLVFTCALFTNIFLVTGVVTSVFGGVMVLSYLVGRSAGALTPSILKSLQADFSTRVVTAVLAVGCVLMIERTVAPALKDIKDALRTPVADSARIGGTDAIGWLAADARETCFFSLTSESALGALAGKPACTRMPNPWYYSRRDLQADLIEELSAHPPHVIHVATWNMDHHYPPNRHVADLFQWTMRHYCPDRILAGRWFWQVSNGSACPIAERTRLPVQTVMVPNFNLQKFTVTVEQPDAPAVGVVIRGQNSQTFLSAGIGSIEQGKLAFPAGPIREMLSQPLDILVSPDGHSLTQAAVVVLDAKGVAGWTR